MLQNKKVTEFLKTILGRPVVVKLNSGVDYRGKDYYGVHVSDKKREAFGLEGRRGLASKEGDMKLASISFVHVT